jgi:hypothetical protein
MTAATSPGDIASAVPDLRDRSVGLALRLQRIGHSVV